MNNNKNQYEKFPNSEDIAKIIGTFPVEATPDKESELKKSYENLISYVKEKIESKDKQTKLYACQYFLTPLREQLFKYYSTNKLLFFYYFNLYETLVPILPNHEKDFVFINWIVKNFFKAKSGISVTLRFRYLQVILDLNTTPEEELELYSKIENLNKIFKFLVFDLIDSDEITTLTWLRLIKKIILYQIEHHLYNIISYHFLFNLICIIVIYKYSLLLDDNKKKEHSTHIDKSEIKKYTKEAIELLDIFLNDIDLRPPHMIHKYLLTIIIASRCLSDINILDDIIRQETKYQTELKIQLFDLIGITKELDNVIKSFKESSLWNENNIANNIYIYNFANKQDHLIYQQKVNTFLNKKMVLSRTFLSTIEFQKYMMRSIVNIFVRDKTKYDIHKQSLFVSFFKSLMKVNIASLDQLFNSVMQPLFCWNDHFTFEWEFIFEFFESRREMFKKNRFYFSYIYQLVDMYTKGNYYGDIKLFEYHYMQWEDLPNDENIQQLYIDFAFKNPYMMINELPKKMNQCKHVKLSSNTFQYLFKKVGNVYVNDKDNVKVNDVIVKYFLPFLDIVKDDINLIKTWENTVYILITKIHDDNVDLIKGIFDYLRKKINEKKYFPFEFIKELIYYTWTNNYINKLRYVNLTFECLLDVIHSNINEFTIETLAHYIAGILNIIKDFSYTYNNEIICGPIQQRSNLSIWKINYKISYDQHETNQFIVFTHQKLFNVFISVISYNKVQSDLREHLLQYIHEVFYKNPFFLTNINLNEFYNYALSSITSLKNETTLQYILTIINDLAYIIPPKYCHPIHKISPYYFPTQEFPSKKDIKRKCIDNLISLSISILEQIKPINPSQKIEPIVQEFNGCLLECGDSEEVTSLFTEILFPNGEDVETIDPRWKRITKLLDCITFQIHSFFNYGSYNINDKYKITCNPYTLFKYLQTKPSIKSSSIREQEIRVVLDTLIQKLLYPIRLVLSKERTIHVDLITFSIFKLFYHNLELFSIFNDISMQVIHFLISLSWSTHLNEVTFKYGNIFPNIRKLTPVNEPFIAEPNLYLRNQINMLICSFAELSPHGEKLCEMLVGILIKNINDVDKTPKEVVKLFLSTLEWNVSIKSKRDAYYNLSTYGSKYGDNFALFEESEETGFINQKHRVVFTKLNQDAKKNFDALIYSPFSNYQMHLRSFVKERTNEDKYRTFNKLNKEINGFFQEENDDNIQEQNEMFLKDSYGNRNEGLGCKIDIPGYLTNKGYQFQYLYTNEMDSFVPLNDINAILSISNLSNSLNEIPVNFFCKVSIFYYCPISNKNAYTNQFMSFISAFTGLPINDLKDKLKNDSFLIIPSQNSQILLTIYNSKDSFENAQKQKPVSTTNYSKIENTVSLIWVDQSNYIDKPSYVILNEKIFTVTIYAFSSQYFTIETKVNEKHPYANSIYERFQMLFQEISIFNSNETYKTISNFISKHIQLLCTIVIDKKLTSSVKKSLIQSPNKEYVTSMFLPKEDNVYSRYTHIINNNKKNFI